MFEIISKSYQCLDQGRFAGAFINFLMSYREGIQAMCLFCPFGFCYSYFIGFTSVFQIVRSVENLMTHLWCNLCRHTRRSSSGDSWKPRRDHPVEFCWPFRTSTFRCHIKTSTSSDTQSTSCRTWSSWSGHWLPRWVHDFCVFLSPQLINFNHFQSAQELVTFTAISFASSVYSLACYVIKFHTFTREQKAVQFVMNMAAILNLMFLICFIFENCKHVYMAPKNWKSKKKEWERLTWTERKAPRPLLARILPFRRWKSWFSDGP